MNKSKCDYKFVAGDRKGTPCNTFIRKKNDQGKCSKHYICQHGIRGGYTKCTKCKGGSTCHHKRLRSQCLPCGGCSFCEHGIRRLQCRHCCLPSFLTNKVSCRIINGYKTIGFDRLVLKVTVYLGCSIEEYIDYLEELLYNQPEHHEVPDWEFMTWDNYGTYWHIDHIIPLSYNRNELTKEILFKRFHYTNTQPLPAYINNNKGSRFIG